MSASLPLLPAWPVCGLGAAGGGGAVLPLFPVWRLGAGAVAVGCRAALLLLCCLWQLQPGARPAPLGRWPGCCAQCSCSVSVVVVLVHFRRLYVHDPTLCQPLFCCLRSTGRLSLCHALQKGRCGSDPPPITTGGASMNQPAQLQRDQHGRFQPGNQICYQKIRADLASKV